MKTIILSLTVLLLSTAAQASENNLVFTCVPGSQPNGLGIERLVLDLSTDDPQGIMTLTYENAKKTLVGEVDYEGAGNRYYIVTPSTKALGDVSVKAVRKNREWTATVTSDSIDTFSALSCEVI
ncbi:MAG: hypothetical protein ACXVBE_07665 [Bdellovibrionota bacterium]